MGILEKKATSNVEDEDPKKYVEDDSYWLHNVDTADKIKCHMLGSADSTEAQHICQSKDVALSPLQIQDNKVSCCKLPQRIMFQTSADSISIEDCLLLFSEELVDWRCSNCTKNHKEPRTSQSKNGEQMVGSGNEDRTVVGNQTEQSDRTACHSKEPECHGGLPAEKQTDLPRTKLSADDNKQLVMCLGMLKQPEQSHTEYQLKEEENEQTHNIGNATQFTLFTMLPPVLTLHLKRYDSFEQKISGHVTFMEYLNVGRFLDPRY